eukprot:CAMPEP_0201879938 /NCGR_PEP_ID=MMETSP0902-20130614/10688_1 /ASSEMBLY_ACC=CAM_ASM_000551 /TAXON_ID=420261 /ORGANISM="Thalassiosira antarctica, Strain CCMP982" /LENGTH=75 /DNA_ID=CAMNT_0048407885 /DNA_START=98 /DNA_END=325 /DNA_ORIENTATION=+
MQLSIVSFVALLASANAFAPAMSGASRTVSLGVQTGAAGQPAKSKEEDLELTREVILEYVNSKASNEGIVDDDDE